MQRLSKSDTPLGGGAGNGGALAKRIAPVAAARLASTTELMGAGDQLAIPRLLGVPAEYLYSAGDSALTAQSGALSTSRVSLLYVVRRSNRSLPAWVREHSACVEPLTSPVASPFAT